MLTVSLNDLNELEIKFYHFCLKYFDDSPQCENSVIDWFNPIFKMDFRKEIIKHVKLQKLFNVVICAFIGLFAKPENVEQAGEVEEISEDQLSLNFNKIKQQVFYAKLSPDFLRRRLTFGLPFT